MYCQCVTSFDPIGLARASHKCPHYVSDPVRVSTIEKLASTGGYRLRLGPPHAKDIHHQGLCAWCPSIELMGITVLTSQTVDQLKA